MVGDGGKNINPSLLLLLFLFFLLTSPAPSTFSPSLLLLNKRERT